jgi:diguanylate cyclase (GGDEF)-like protein
LPLLVPAPSTNASSTPGGSPLGAPPSVLLADHRGAGLADLAPALARVGFAVTRSDSVVETRMMLSRDVFYPVVVLDPLAPGGGTEVELVARTGPKAPRALLIVTNPAGPPPPAARARELRGVPYDIVRRDAPLEEVVLRIERLLEQAALRAELVKVRYEAHHDDRTGLLRPGPFQQRLREHFSAAQRHGLPLALALIDLDRFGRVNKDFDHMVGDELITRTGSVIQRCLRTEDVGGRLGGDEFGVALPYTQPVDAARVIQRLLGEIHGLSGDLPHPNGAPMSLVVSGSIGFETFDGRDVESAEALRRHAETALREAKNEGGNIAVYYRSIAGRSVTERSAGQRDTEAPSTGSAHEDRP